PEHRCREDEESTVMEVLSKPSLWLTPWKIVACGGADASIGEGGASAVGLTVQWNDDELEYYHVNLGGIGVSLGPLVAGFSMSPASWPSVASRVFRLPGVGVVSYQDFARGFLLLSIGGDVGVGGSGAAILMGGIVGHVMALGAGGPFGQLLMPYQLVK